MGFFIKKGFNFGPLRLNLSKSGLGCSFGLKGLRVGANNKGAYVHAGRQGIYYRKSLKAWSFVIALFVVAIVYGLYWAYENKIITINL